MSKKQFEEAQHEEAEAASDDDSVEGSDADIDDEDGSETGGSDDEDVRAESEDDDSEGDSEDDSEEDSESESEDEDSRDVHQGRTVFIRNVFQDGLVTLSYCHLPTFPGYFDPTVLLQEIINIKDCRLLVRYGH